MEPAGDQVPVFEAFPASGRPVDAQRAHPRGEPAIGRRLTARRAFCKAPALGDTLRGRWEPIGSAFERAGFHFHVEHHGGQLRSGGRLTGKRVKCQIGKKCQKRCRG